MNENTLCAPSWFLFTTKEHKVTLRAGSLKGDLSNLYRIDNHLVK